MLTETLHAAMLRHIKYSMGKDEFNAKTYDVRMALCMAVRDRIVEPWFSSTRAAYKAEGKRVFYLSMEFLIGRLLWDAVVNLQLEHEARRAVTAMGHDFEEVLANEPDAALGNGGLGRLAACFLDSMSTLGCPGYGYGIRYEHGLFRQSFHEGRQIETAEDWLRQKHAWEFERHEAHFLVGFGGELRDLTDGRREWVPHDAIVAQAYDTPVIGWQGRWANTLRLWQAQPLDVFDLEAFNRGDFAGATAQEALARTISRVLYPDDTTEAGRELRLRQEYFFTAASLADILRRYRHEFGDLRKLPQRVAIQLNDTHPAVAGPELVRILHDEDA
ncbi:MAG: glycogen/starch/alpha-glucan phosphorylase, partial [Rhodobacteraceae bacterium]|nr:glycogen/starch/alpha-glucan phosphorylase [Paracoccaceae bacterium]